MKRMFSLFIALVMAFSLLSTAFPYVDTAYAAGNDAMPAIRAAFDENYLLCPTVEEKDDGYLHVPISVTTYVKKDSSGNTTTNAMSKVMVYVVNTPIERVGTESDTTIIQSFLDRNYVVCVVDYKNNSLAVAPALDWSAQSVRKNINIGKFFYNKLNSGVHYKAGATYIIPAGYDITADQVFWSLDKHGADGTLDYIVQVWNADFRSTKFNNTVYWWNDDTNTPKKFRTDISYEEGAQWKDEANHIAYVGYTEAETIFDCVKPDGSPFDYDLAMDIIYPTNPVNEVPVYCWAASAEARINSWNAGRPHLSGFLFRGYAGVVYDYCYVPMARADHYDYFDGDTTAGHVTGDNRTYSCSIYNGIKVDTAALRMLRYYSEMDHNKYHFNEIIGVSGGSKSGYITKLGNRNVELLPEVCYFPGHHGETRYESYEITGDTSYVTDVTRKGTTIRKGEVQPWLTYPSGSSKAGQKIRSNADFIYSAVGGETDTIMEGNAPMYSSGSMQDGTYAGFYQYILSQCRTMDVPLTSLSMPKLGHSFCEGVDKDYNIDSYAAFFWTADYWLKNAPSRLLYVNPIDTGELIDTDTEFTLKFTGAVSAEEIQKVTLTDELGQVADGEWTPFYGRTEWHFRPYSLKGMEEYTLNVPANLMAENGTAILEPVQKHYSTKYETVISAESDGDTVLTAENGNGLYVAFDSSYLENALDSSIRINVVNDAANIAEVYALSSISDDLTESTAGNLIGTINLCGAGAYDLKIKDIANSLVTSGKIGFLIKAKNSVGEKPGNIGLIDFESANLGNITAPSGIRMSSRKFNGENVSLFNWQVANLNGNKVLDVVSGKSVSGPVQHLYTEGRATVLYSDDLITSKLTSADYGRKFRISFDVYDETSRQITYGLSDKQFGKDLYHLLDSKQNKYTYFTSENEWETFAFEYTVDDMKYTMDNIQKKVLYIGAQTFGDNDTRAALADSITVPKDEKSGEVKRENSTNPSYQLYIDNISCTEIVSSIDVSSVELVVQPVKTATIYPVETASIVGDQVTTNPDELIVGTGSKTTQNGGISKTYLKFDLTNFDPDRNNVVKITSNGNGATTVDVWGLNQDLEGSLDDFNSYNAPANDRHGFGVDTSKVYLGMPITTLRVVDNNTYTIDVSSYFAAMKNKGANNATLILTGREEEPSHITFIENFDGSKTSTLFCSTGGTIVSQGKSIEDEYDPNSEDPGVYKVSVGAYGRMRWDVLESGGETDETKKPTVAKDLGRTYRVTFKVKIPESYDENGNVIPNSTTLKMGLIYGYAGSGSYATNNGFGSSSTTVNPKTLSISQGKWVDAEYIITLTEDIIKKRTIFLNTEPTNTKYNGKSTNSLTLYFDNFKVEEIARNNISLSVELGEPEDPEDPDETQVPESRLYTHTEYAKYDFTDAGEASDFSSDKTLTVSGGMLVLSDVSDYDAHYITKSVNIPTGQSFALEMSTDDLYTNGAIKISLNGAETVMVRNVAKTGDWSFYFDRINGIKVFFNGTEVSTDTSVSPYLSYSPTTPVKEITSIKIAVQGGANLKPKFDYFRVYGYGDAYTHRLSFDDASDLNYFESKSGTNTVSDGKWNVTGVKEIWPKRVGFTADITQDLIVDFQLTHPETYKRVDIKPEWKGKSNYGQIASPSGIHTATYNRSNDTIKIYKDGTQRDTTTLGLTTTPITFIGFGVIMSSSSTKISFDYYDLYVQGMIAEVSNVTESGLKLYTNTPLDLSETELSVNGDVCTVTKAKNGYCTYDVTFTGNLESNTEYVLTGNLVSIFGREKAAEFPFTSFAYDADAPVKVPDVNMNFDEKTSFVHGLTDSEFFNNSSTYNGCGYDSIGSSGVDYQKRGNNSVALATDKDHTTGSGKSVKFVANDSYSALRFYNTFPMKFTEDEIGDQYTISFWAYSDAAVNFRYGLQAANNYSQYGDGDPYLYVGGKTVAGNWTKYQTTITVDELMIDTYDYTASTLEKAKVFATPTMLAIKLLSASTIYIDDILVKHTYDASNPEGPVVDPNEEVELLPYEAKGIKDNENIANYPIGRLPSSIVNISENMAYLPFPNAQTLYAQKAYLKFALSRANGQILSIYALKGTGAFTGKLDDTLLYSEDPIATVVADHNGEYSVDVTEYANKMSEERLRFVITSDTSSGLTYYDMGFDTFSLTSGADYEKHGQATISIQDEKMLITDVSNGGVIFNNIFGADNKVAQSGNYVVSADIKNTSSSAATFKIAVVGEDGSTIVSNSTSTRVTAGSTSHVSYTCNLNESDLTSKPARIMITSDDATSFELDNIVVNRDTSVHILPESVAMSYIIPGGTKLSWQQDGFDLISDETPTEIDNFIYTIEDDKITILGLSQDCKDAEIRIGNKYEVGGIEYEVASIGDSAFAFADKIEVLYIPKSVEVIGNDITEGCTNLRTVYKPIDATWDYSFGDEVSVIDVCTITYTGSYQGEETVVYGKNSALFNDLKEKYNLTVNGQPWNGKAVTDNLTVVVSVDLNVNFGVESIALSEEGLSYSMEITANEKISGDVILATYNNKNALVKAYVLGSVENEMTKQFDGTVESDDTVNTYKAFVWDKLQGLSPIADAVFGIVEK